MRIISGKLKGKNILFLKSSTTRPLKDFVKENIFNIIDHSNLFNTKIKNSNILDLYSGIGSFGLECLSREAKNVTFVEKDRNAIRVLEKNLLNLSINEKSLVLFSEIDSFLNKAKSEKFYIIFLNTPFAHNTFIRDLKMIKEKNIFKKNHLIIIHRENKSEEHLSKILDLLLVRKYGRSKLIFGKF